LIHKETTQNRHLQLQKNLRIRMDSGKICGFGYRFGIRNNTIIRCYLRS